MDTLRNGNLAPERHAGAAGALGRYPVTLDGGAALFGWYHSIDDAAAKDCAVVICSPLGHEYTHSHRSLRHLADRLARAGLPALRFDFRGVGDSPGDDFDSRRLRGWLDDIHAAIAKVRQLSGRSRVCLLGVRLGATLAALAAGETGVDHLILWSPCVSGRRYLREMKAIARASGSDSSNSSMLESAGFMLSEETQAELQQVDLLQQTFQVRRKVLVIDRDDLDTDMALPEKFQFEGIGVDHLKLPGYEGMFAEPQFTEVPHIAIEAITQWLGAQTPDPFANFTPPPASTPIRLEQPDGDGRSTTITEQPCRFGEHEQLFGIVSHRGEEPAADKPVIVMLNSGSVHHVGPNRLYVLLSRALSARGFTCLRMDLEGLGDSVSRRGERENHPYQTTALADADSAMTFLRARFQCRRFILLGLCSGAHTAFHAGLELEQHQLDDLILLNPLTFHWQEGMSLATTQHFQDVAYYRRSARSAKSWLKLLQGKVNLLYIARVALSQLGIALKARGAALAEILLRRPSTPLAADLARLWRRGRPLSLFIAGRDPGYDILLANAKHMARKSMREQKIHLQFIEDADHTFSKYDRRMALIEKLVRHIEKPPSRAWAEHTLRKNASGAATAPPGNATIPARAPRKA